MSTSEKPADGIAPHGLVRFTQRGEEALDALAADLAASCDGSQDGIAQLLSRVLDADLVELASSLTTAADRTEDQGPVVDVDLTQTPETPDETASRRLGRHQFLPPAGGGTQPSRFFHR